MPRKRRKISKIGLYHVMLRGINKQNIFFDDDDYITMMRTLMAAHIQRNREGKIIRDNDCAIYAFAIMPNHVHILIQELDYTLSTIMKRIEDRYVYFYNKRYERVGHLFQDRYRSEPVDDPEYFRQLIRYIHRNPVKGMLCKSPEEYPYSSWREYVDPERAIMQVCKRDKVLEVFPLDQMKPWVEMDIDDDCMDMDKERFVLSDQHAKDIICDLSETDNIEEFRQLDPCHQLEYIRAAVTRGVTIRQASRLSILSYSKLQRELLSVSEAGQGVRPLDPLKTDSKLEVIKQVLAEGGEMKASEIAEKIGLKATQTRNYLILLIDRGEIEAIGSSRGRRYRTLLSV